jgi:probable rRNA maturation factor
MLIIQLANQQESLAVDEPLLCEAVRAVLEGEGVRSGEISLAVVDDPTIHELNRNYLEHDYPTDVLSFVLEEADDRLDGEVIVSADTALSAAPRYGWAPQDELLLYVIHGSLHLAGYLDETPEERREMRDRERTYLARFGRAARYEDSEEEVV